MNAKRARGITLESLLKLSETVAFNRKTTVLHFLCTVIEKSDADAMLWTDDMPLVQTVASYVSVWPSIHTSLLLIPFVVWTLGVDLRLDPQVPRRNLSVLKTELAQAQRLVRKHTRGGTDPASGESEGDMTAFLGDAQAKQDRAETRQQSGLQEYHELLQCVPQCSKPPVAPPCFVSASSLVFVVQTRFGNVLVWFGIVC